ncbi:MAG: GTPase Era [Caldilineaceae bacterium]|nr:GTPase Era [Caldilineaceae bacterium]
MLESLLNQQNLAEDYRSGFVAVIGRPNVGKSTLLNRLLGQKIAITSDKPQTTRDQILGIRTEENGQYIFLDTPGIHRPKHKLGQHMVQVAEESITNDADVVLWLVDISVPPTDEDELIAARLHELHGGRPLPPILLGLNKIDEWHGDAAALEDRTQTYRALLRWLAEETGEEIPTLRFSAISGQGVDELLENLRQQLPQGPQYFPEDQVTDLNMRFLVAELIREQVLNSLHQEVPHSVAVGITDFEERSNNLTYIAATIYVERASQKGIVLGSGGAMIKQIGRLARPQIEEMVGTKVYLELWVKVWEKWRRKDNMLRRLGYEINRR